MLFNKDISIIVIYQKNFGFNCFVKLFLFFIWEEVDVNWPMGEGLCENPQSVLNIEFSQ